VPDRLIAVAAELPPPFVLLEDGRGDGATVLAWAPAQRVRVEWSDAATGSLDALELPANCIGAIAYDLGLPPHALRRTPIIAQPLADLFTPTQRITLRPGRDAEIVGDEARARWAAAVGGEWVQGATRGAVRAVRPAERAAPASRHDATPGPGGQAAARDAERAAPASRQGASPASRGGATPGSRGHQAATHGAERAVPASRRSFDQPAFERAVHQALEYIRAGDIYQVNLSVAECVPLAEPPFDVYRRLRAINPSPWMGYADFGDWQLVCGSPELLVEVVDGKARAKPIAGTRKKTGDAAADAAMRRELVSDAKEAAEHVMLVDLARNDLGRVAEFGSVRVAELGAVEAYSHVMHLVSDVRATLRPGATPLDVLRAMFPGGTVTGTPKIRAMEIIAELEPVARGFYTGALGWTGPGAAQWNIVIRSAVVRGGDAVIQAGAGIVADSDPAREWKESLRKAAALRVALGIEP
jgi:para-aminobenzoate synthetase component 1